MKVFSMFSGIGGFDLAAQNLGHQIIGACEIDDSAGDIYARHFPDITVWRDATRLDASQVPDHDLLCAGFPCQPFSVCGARLGLEDVRGTLFYEIVRIAEQKRPRLLLLENVLGLLNHKSGYTFAVLLGALDAVGYDAEWQVLDSRYFVPQSRERVFIIGHLRGKPARQVFPLGEIRTTHKKSTPVTHSGALKANYQKLPNDGTYVRQVGSVGKDLRANRVYDPKGIAVALLGQSGGGGGKTGLYEVRPAHLKTSDQINGPAIGEKDAPAYSLTTLHGGNGVEVRPVHTQPHSVKNGQLVGAPNAPSYALTAWESDNGIQQGSRIRRLTPGECEILQGFPKSYTASDLNGPVSDARRYKALGNAVTVPVVEYIIKHLS